jgi:deazaflavin-dependent oxidoreductase (nitroreductase family)
VDELAFPGSASQARPPARSDGRATDLAAAVDDDFCYLTTRGRRSGQPHEIEIWFALDGGTLYLLAGARDDSDWVRNLQADPAITVRVRDRTYTGTGRVIDEDDESERARTLVFDKYQPRYSGSLADWRIRSLPVAVDLTEEA